MTSHANLLTSEQSLLLFIDIQPKLTKVMPEQDAELMVTNTNKLIAAAKLLAVPMVVTEQYPEKLGATVPEISENLPESTCRLAKMAFSCVNEPAFQRFLQTNDRKQIILCGQEAHICILQTALELLSADYQVYVVTDAVCSRKPAHKFEALQRMQQHGVTIINYESLLFEWLKTAAHIHFKTISAFLR